MNSSRKHEIHRRSAAEKNLAAGEAAKQIDFVLKSRERREFQQRNPSGTARKIASGFLLEVNRATRSDGGA